MPKAGIKTCSQEAYDRELAVEISRDEERKRTNRQELQYSGNEIMFREISLLPQDQVVYNNEAKSFDYCDADCAITARNSQTGETSA